MAIATTLPVSRVVNVAVEMSPTAAALRNFGSCLILGDSDIIDTDERIRLYSSISDIATDFGISSREYLAAQAFFSQSPQPTQVYIGRWAKSATAGRLRGRTLSSAEQDISLFTAITTGTLSLTIDGASKSMASIDLSAETNLNGVASQISSALGVSGSCAWTGERFVITSATTGTSSTVATTDTGTLSSLMGFAGSATSVAGVAAESLASAITALLDYNTWYMVCVAPDASDDSIVEAAGLIEAASPSRMIGFTTQNSTEIDSTASSTLGSRLKGLGYNRTILVYSSDSPVAAASVFGRMATINFEGSNTTLTLKFKQLPGVTAENLRSSQAEALKSHNVNAFCAYQNDTSILQEGITSGGWFIDETHGLDWLQNRVETDLWNLLYTSKKVGQDESGATAIVSCVNKSLEQGVANGLIAPGVWNGDAFGALESGDTLSTGYYVYIQPFDEQSQSDREARKAPPIQIAVKLKGAVHFINVTITVNR
nr:MAG TPA: tail sheath protein [Caudoviricetes sp.]